jgi:hypothetical protein
LPICVSSAPNCRWRISSYCMVGIFCCGPFPCRPMIPAISLWPGRTRRAVDCICCGKERQINARFLAMFSHRVFHLPSIRLGSMHCIKRL